jgi:hypothetical protein
MFLAATAASGPMAIVTAIYLAGVAPTLPPETAGGLNRLLLTGCAGAVLCALTAAWGVSRLVTFAEFCRRLVTDQAAENGQRLEEARVAEEARRREKEALQLELRRQAETLSRAATT